MVFLAEIFIQNQTHINAASSPAAADHLLPKVSFSSQHQTYVEWAFSEKSSLAQFSFIQHHFLCFSTCNSCLVLPLHIVEKLLEVVAVVTHPQAIYIALKQQSNLVDFSLCIFSHPRAFFVALKQSNRNAPNFSPEQDDMNPIFVVVAKFT